MLLSLMMKGQINEFQTLYQCCIATASDLRKTNGTLTCGENIDHPDILNRYKDTVRPIQWLQTAVNSDKKVDYSTLLGSRGEELFSTFYDRDYPSMTSSDLMMYIKQYGEQLGRGMLVSRHGQSFSLAGVGKGKVMIYDTHYRHTGIVTPEQAYKHIMFGSNEYTLILWAPVSL